MRARTAYQSAIHLAKKAEERLDPRSAYLGLSRVLVVLAMAALWFTTGRAQASDFAWAYALGVVLFIVTWILQTAVDRQVAQARRRIAYYSTALQRLDGAWHSFPSTGARYANDEHPYARDLDLFGPGSLFQLLDTTRTSQGEARLAGWLMAPSTIEEVRDRATTVRAITLEVAARERLALAGYDEDAPRIDQTTMLTFADEKDRLPSGGWIRVASFALPGLFIVTGLGAWMGVVPTVVPLAVVAGELWLLRQWREPIAASISVAQRSRQELEKLLPLLTEIATQPRSTPRLMQLIGELEGAEAAIESLRRRASFIDSRSNQIVALIAPALLWDLHGALLMESWRREHGRFMRRWLDALGEFEALHALATYAFEHPDDAWPELAPGGPTFVASGLGHPLIEPAKCVRNDVSIEGPGRVLLVTGSNMSGKSTLLRSIGLATVMSLAGLPVRASKLRLSPMQAATCMRVTDSLQQNASLFLAEVQRLKKVVDLAGGPVPLLFLLDEILQGTHTRERSIGAKGVVRLLVSKGATGLVSTHDLSLVALGETLGSHLEFFHFTDRVEEGRMVFDYTMRPGVVQGSNALRVMRAQGLDVELPEGADGV